MPEPSTLNYNRAALFFLILGKALGVGGLVLGAVHRVAGGTLLVLDGLFIFVAIALCLRLGQKQVREDNSDKATIARLLREGTLRQYVQEVEREAQRKEEESATAAAEATAE